MLLGILTETILPAVFLGKFEAPLTERPAPPEIFKSIPYNEINDAQNKRRAPWKIIVPKRSLMGKTAFKGKIVTK